MYCSSACRRAGDLRRKLGATIIDAKGYVRQRTEQGWELEHRLVMARAIGRPLLGDEAVHHRNGDKANNGLANLELCVVGARSHPPGQRVVDLLAWARYVIDEYAAVENAIVPRSARR